MLVARTTSGRRFPGGPPPPQFGAAKLGDDNRDDGDFTNDAGDSVAHGGVDMSIPSTTEVGSPAGRLRRFMFGDLASPSDTSIDRQRKIVIGWGLPLALLPLAFFAYVCAELIARSDAVESSEQGSGKTGLALAAIAMVVFAMTWLAINVSVRISRNLSPLLCDVWLFATIFGALLMHIALIDYPMPQIAFYIAALVFLCDTPRRTAQLVLCAMLYALALVNDAIKGSNVANAEHLAAVPGAYWATMAERFVYQASSMIVAAIVAASLRMQASDRAESALAEAAAARFARRVADELIRFDTDAAIAAMHQLRVQNFDAEGAYIDPDRYPGAAAANRVDEISRRSQSPPRSQQQSPNASTTAAPEAARRFANSSLSQSNTPTTHALPGGDGATPTPTQPPSQSARHHHPRRPVAGPPEPLAVVSVDHRLIESFELLVNHFEQFRPHLPQWLLSTATFQGERLAGAHRRDDEAAGAGGGGDADVDNETEGDLVVSVDDSNGSANGDLLSPMTRHSITSGGHTGLTPRQRFSTGATPTNGAGNGSSGNLSGRRRHGGSGSHGPPHAKRYQRSPMQQRLSNASNGSSDGGGVHPMMRMKSSKISVVWVDFTRLVSPDPRDAGTANDPLATFVDVIHEAADATYGAVHSFVGDSVIATWNTGRQCAQVECKAARFLAAVRDATQMHDGLVIAANGVAMTGEALVQLAGLLHRQHALTVGFASWRTQWRQLAAFARQVDALLLDEPTFAAANFTIEACLADYVCVSKASNPCASGGASPASSPLMPRHQLTIFDGAGTGFSGFGPRAALHARSPKVQPMPGPVQPPGLLNGSFAEGTASGNATPPPQPVPLAPPVGRIMPVYEVLRDLNTRSTRHRNGVHGGGVQAQQQPWSMGGVHAHTHTAGGGGGGDRPEEWMYTLAKHERGATVAAREAIALAQQGKFGLARDLLEAALRRDAAQAQQEQQAGRARIPSVSSLTSAQSFGSASATPRGVHRTNSNRAAGGNSPSPRVGGPGAPTGSAGSNGAVHLASATLPPCVPPMQRRLLHKLETFAADPNASWAAFPEDLTRFA